MGDVVPFPKRVNQADEDFSVFIDSVIEDPDVTDFDMAELIFSMREFTDFCLAGDKNLRRLYKMLYFK